MLSQFKLEYLVVVLLSVATWAVPLMSIWGKNRLQFRIVSLFAIMVLAGALCLIGFDFAVGFLVFGGGVGLLFTWLILSDSAV